MKPKQSELTDEEPSPAEIFSCDWTWRSGGVSFCTAVAESVRIENSKRVDGLEADKRTKGMWLGFQDSVWLIHVPQLNQVAEGKKKRMKRKQSELTDEEPSSAWISCSVWTLGSAVVSS